MALRIKDNVNLKELEKFGFVPHYDCDTGKINYWHKKIYDKNFYSKKYTEYIIEVSNCGFNYHSTSLIKKKKEIKNLIKFNKALCGDAYDLFFDTLFDLIQAGLVEKVVEE